MSDSEGSVYSYNESEHEEGREEGGSNNKNRSRIFSRSRSCSDDDGPRKKKRKMEQVYDFIIREAEVDGEPEDDEEWEEGARDIIIDDNEVAESVLTAKEIEGRRRGTNLWKLEDEMTEEYLRNKYVHEPAAAHRFGYGGEDISDEITQQKLLPCIKDPNLWMVKCRVGEEKATALLMMRKFLTYQFSGEPLQIKSVVVPEGLKGYIYIESHKQSHVKAAMQNVSNLSMGLWKQQMVPIKEMTDVLRVVKKQTGFKVKQWVRLNRGIYKDDIAQVQSVNIARNQVHLKLLPRIDYTRLRGALRTTQRESETIKRNKKRNPPAKPFNPEAIRAIGGKVTRDGDFLIFERNFYSHRGFLYKNFTTSSVTSEGVTPTLSELEIFEETLEDVDIELSGAPVTGVSTGKNDQTIRHAFSTGDMVEVCEGELMKMRGKVVSVDDTIMVMPKHKDLKEPVKFQASDLRKYFTIGDHVKVVAGRHEGNTGLIVRVKPNHVVLFTDLTMHELEVLPRDLQLSGGSKASTAATLTPMTRGLTTPSIASPMHPRGGGARGGGGRRDGRRGAGARRDQQLIGITIKITGGAYKGNVGIIRDVTGTTVRVELHSTCQTISVDRSRIANIDVATKNGGFSSYGGTPAYGTGSQTPMYSSNGTPTHGSETPDSRSSRTPGRWDAWDPTVRNTPARTSDFDC